MKVKKLVLGLVSIGIIAGVATIGYIYVHDKGYAEKLIALSKNNEKAKVVEKVFYDNGCQYCHQVGAEQPFYSKIPIMSDMFKHDIKLGINTFILNRFVDNLSTPEKISEADLAKLEKVIVNNEMPLTSFKHVHIGSSLNDSEKATLLDFIREQRKQRLLNVKGTDIANMVQPIPDSIPTDPAKVALGKKLYNNTDLSFDGTVACASCHGLDIGGVDGLDTSTGIYGQKGPINAPTVYNAAFNISQFWDGRAVDLADQAGGPPFNPLEMGSHNWDEIVAKIQQKTDFTQEFLAIYPELTGKNIQDAIGEYEKTLITPNSAFDRYLKGDNTALTAQQKHGYELFVENKCDTCHTGPSMGGQSYELMGTKADYFADRGNPTDADLGRFAFSKDPVDMHRFKVPNLRNIALTAPYFHDAYAKNLTEATELMLKYQTGVVLPKDDVAAIVSFLDSLTGEMDGKILTNKNQKN